MIKFIDFHNESIEKMLILGIDTSCDDTSAAVVEDSGKIISNIISNQDEIHVKYGGIVPELASRKHIEMIWPVVHEAIKKAKVSLGDVSAVAVSHGPGLIGSLLIGVCFAKSLSFVHNIPLIAVNHLEGHVLSIFLEETPEFPFVALVVSGGHTNIYIVNDFGDYIEMGKSRDDAAGEAFDKVSKLLGFGYPGGPVIDTLSSKGNPEAINFPRALIRECHDFSFSGLKTAVFNHIKKNPHAPREDIAASFQSAVVDVLTYRAVEVATLRGIKRIVLSGGVSANTALRKKMKLVAEEKDIDVLLPSPQLCTDNAAMISLAAFHHFINGDTADLSLNPKAYMPLVPADG